MVNATIRHLSPIGPTANMREKTRVIDTTRRIFEEFVEDLWCDSFISHRAFCESLTDGGLFKHSTTVASITKSKQTSRSAGPSIHLAQTSESNMIRTSMGCNSPPARFLPSLDQQSQHIYQQKFDTTQHNFLGTCKNYGNNDESSSAHNAAAMMPQLSAASLLPKASQIG
ncbi:hypothetical protein R6Q59_005900 [Mikania micrantha]